MNWQLPFGAALTPGGVFFRVWAPDRRQVEVLLLEENQEPRAHALHREADGYWSCEVSGAQAGVRYWYRLDGALARPDPASRAQPDGVHGPSQVVDPAFDWRDVSAENGGAGDCWRGIRLEEAIIYELHVGTFTPAGTFEAAIERLPDLAALGVTAIEIMPVADFPGARNWGYDGVDWYAPARAYGGVAGFKRLVDAAHANGLAVILDVVYNHFGPSGAYLRDFSAGYFTEHYHTPWGAAINYGGPGARPVRELMIENALYWAHEYHVDGLRLDATQEIYDDSAEHVLTELARRVRSSLPEGRRFLIFAEDPRNLAALVQPADQGGYGLDAVWADDFSHVLRVLLTGDRHAYLAAYQGLIDELVIVLEQGWLYQGQPDPLTGWERGTPCIDLPPAGLVYNIQTHDHVGNRAFGDRLHQPIDPAEYRAASTLLLLAPAVPLLFMGQEYAASTPFLYFTDHDPELGVLVREGRAREFSFQAGDLPDPQAAETFERSKLRWEERGAPFHAAILRLYRDLIVLRRSEPACRLDRGSPQTRARALGERSVAVLRSADAGERQRLLLVLNFGRALTVNLEELTGLGARLDLLLDSESEIYGGRGALLSWQGSILLDGPRALVFRFDKVGELWPST